MNNTGKSLWQRACYKLARLRHQARLRASLKHVHGPKTPVSAPDEVTVISLVRDGAYYLSSFFAYYRSLGIRHFVFIDNGSTDDTLDLIRAQPGTVILSSDLPWGTFENAFRRTAAERYCRNRWCLYVDMDEIFDFQGRDQIGLTGLIKYLEQQGFTAMMAQMLEMFPKGPLNAVANLPYDQVLEQFHYCDVSTIRRLDYHSEDTGFSYFLRQNTLSDPETQILFGGVRGKIFGENCCLSKHLLVYVGDRVQPGVHPHCSANVAVADVSAVIKHYKFANDSAARDRASLAGASIQHGEDKLRAKRMEKTPDLSLWSETAQDYPGVTSLQSQGFLMGSDSYNTYITGADQ